MASHAAELELRRLFDRAVELRGDARRAFLDGVADELLRERLQALLARDAEPTAPALQRPLIAGRPAPTRVGNFELLRTLGSGGMGVVVLARQIEPIERLVALKFLDDPQAGDHLLQRFRAEREALARMDHPGIARVLDGGVTDDGAPYFAMEYVRGEPLAAYCDRRRLTLNERLTLVAEVCDALQHAHQKGVVHRDLKPSNLLVVERDGGAHIKVIDFGLAHAVTGRLVSGEAQTHTGDILGTPAYMSPEQAAPGGLDVDTRTDIYSLGVVLFELVVGQTPLRPGTDATAFLQFRTDLLQGRTPRASTIIRELPEDVATERAAQRGTSAAEWLRSAAGDLGWILGKALEGDRNRRYASASEFALDVRRLLAGEPVSARAPTWSYLALRFVQRHRWGTLAGLLAVGGLLGGATAAWLSKIQAETAGARLATVALRQSAIAEFEEFVQLFGDPGMDGTAPSLRQALGAAATVVEARWSRSPTEESAVRAWIGKSLLLLGEPNAAREQLRKGLLVAAAAQIDDPGWELDARSDLSRALRQLGDPAGSREQLQPMLRLAAAALRAETPESAAIATEFDLMSAMAPPSPADAPGFLARCDRIVDRIRIDAPPARARRAVGELLFTMAVAFEQDGIPGADALLSRIESIARSAYGDDAEFAIVLGRLAENRLRMGHVAEALALADEQLAACTRLRLERHWLSAQAARLRGLALFLDGDEVRGEAELLALRARTLPFATTGNARVRAAFEALDELARLLVARDDLAVVLGRSWSNHVTAADAPPWWPSQLAAGAPNVFLLAALAHVQAQTGHDALRSATIGSLLLRIGQAGPAAERLAAAVAAGRGAPEIVADLAIAAHLSDRADERDRALARLRAAADTADAPLSARAKFALDRAQARIR